MEYKDFVIRKIGNQFFAYYQGKTKGFTGLAKGGHLSIMGDYFSSLSGIQSSIRAFHKRNRVQTFCIGEVYESGKLWLVGYHTSHKHGAEVEFITQTFTSVRNAKNWITNNITRFRDLILFSTSFDRPLEIIEIYDTNNRTTN